MKNAMGQEIKFISETDVVKLCQTKKTAVSASFFTEKSNLGLLMSCDVVLTHNPRAWVVLNALGHKDVRFCMCSSGLKVAGKYAGASVTFTMLEKAYNKHGRNGVDALPEGYMNARENTPSEVWLPVLADGECECLNCHRRDCVSSGTRMVQEKPKQATITIQ